ncbi:MAG TPA: tRNA (adenosine(37)-N6)-threonylcarbamoyltransferase complex transferase subunit TsaD [Candidatus Nitrosocosmicus sp.]|nr:tRNA (adenosine(37)-N6)-threonylcarbamoyltransferase complex transferase subunit TsaD [Candidatus Nitrosocosmicus sp.]
MKILSIETSCDETAAAVTEGRKVLSQAIYSQVLIHKKWGGVVPNLAKRAHEEKIDPVIEESLKKAKITMSDIDYIAVTVGPGLAVALETGIRKAKELSIKFNKPIISINHMEGHIYSPFVQNSKGTPVIDFEFPYLVLLISGGHTEFVLFKDHMQYEIIGEKIDDAAGEALDKAARMLGLGYPGGSVLERLAKDVHNIDPYKFPRPMIHSENLNFSFSGLKTSFYYYLKQLSDEEKNDKIKELASSFQEAVFDTLLIKTEKAIKQTGINKLIVGGGVSSNLYLRSRLRTLMKKNNGNVLFPSFKYLSGDNAAMIGVAAYYKAERNMFVNDIDSFQRIPRLRLGNQT